MKRAHGINYVISCLGYLRIHTFEKDEVCATRLFVTSCNLLAAGRCKFRLLFHFITLYMVKM